jgi:tetraprenyl-beta-curcumene synthase
MGRVYRHVLPGVRRELDHWRAAAEAMPDPELRRQAIASMTTKRFHCEGGAIYAVADLTQTAVLLPLIVAFQTISDYLDNLCDRGDSRDGTDFACLHRAMLDAVDPAACPGEYYAYRPGHKDGGYLSRLVTVCRARLGELPAYAVVQPHVRELVALYCDLQVHKHVEHEQREARLLAWWQPHRARYPNLLWNEFAAATGSTLGVFALFQAATDPRLSPDAAAALRDTYFPYLCGLHILLDYLIDQEEDRRGGDLNFCGYYEGPAHTTERLRWIIGRARTAVRQSEHPRFHRMIIEGLVALYLTDRKVARQPEVREVARRLMRCTSLTRCFFWLNGAYARARA